MTFWQNRMFREVSHGEALLTRHSQNTAIYILSWLFVFQSCVGHMHHFAGCLLASYPRKHFSLQCLESSHTLSLSHTTLTNKAHTKYRVKKIEHNYNQIWHKIKANKTHSCKLQLYNLSWHCVLRLISLVNSYFWWVNSAMAVAMDCTCWMEGSCTIGVDYRSRWGLLETSLLS